MGVGTLPIDSMHGAFQFRRRLICLENRSYQIQPVRNAVRHPTVCSNTGPARTRLPSSCAKGRTKGRPRRPRAADIEDSDLAELEEGFESAEAQLEAQFVEDTRSQGGGSLARGILSDPEIEGNPLSFLRVSEAFWTGMRDKLPKRGQTVIRVRHRRLPAPPDYDVAVCGGSLGILVALALQVQGWRVCVIEKRRVEGRNQEWNISRAELEILVELGLLTPSEMEQTVVSEFNPIRISFKGGVDFLVSDVLNLGVSPRLLIQQLKDRFLQAGGVILEDTSFISAEVHTDGVALRHCPVSVAFFITFIHLKKFNYNPHP
eukprot:jgi/Botrbrau1/3498/Bobra.341_2s0028.1